MVLLSRGRYYKVEFFLLQCGVGITKGIIFITKWGRYCKVGQSLQSRAVQWGGDAFIKSYFLKERFSFRLLDKKTREKSCLMTDNEAHI